MARASMAYDLDLPTTLPWRLSLSLSLPALALRFLLFPLFHRAIFSGKRKKTREREERTLSDATSSSSSSRVVIIIKIRLDTQNATTERQKGSRSNLTHKLDSTSWARPKRSHKRRDICISLIAVILLVVVLIVILAFTVFKAKHPVTKVNSVKLENLRVSLRSAQLGVDLNAILDLDLSVKNPNKVGFEYKNSTALLYYRGEVVREVPIPADEISADETKRMNLTLTMLANRFLSNSHMYSDYLSGVLPLNTFTTKSGKLIITGLFEVHVVSTTSYDLSVFVSNATVGNQPCRHKTKFKW